ncbi:hypothetical protein [Arthrobacter sp. KK5.5]|uniref:hypothetical protein n=1 Tax=Arthrobacter sp. KK5.5 TaxID=3373084 RepID=UPI003EE622F9
MSLVRVRATTMTGSTYHLDAWFIQLVRKLANGDSNRPSSVVEVAGLAEGPDRKNLVATPAAEMGPMGCYT